MGAHEMTRGVHAHGTSCLVREPPISLIAARASRVVSLNPDMPFVLSFTSAHSVDQAALAISPHSIAPHSSTSSPSAAFTPNRPPRTSSSLPTQRHHHKWPVHTCSCCYPIRSHASLLFATCRPAHVETGSERLSHSCVPAHSLRDSRLLADCNSMQLLPARRVCSMGQNGQVL